MGKRHSSVFTVKSILGYKKHNNCDYYLIEWEGYSKDEATWEPRSCFISPTDELLVEMKKIKEKFLSSDALKSYNETKSNKVVRHSPNVSRNLKKSNNSMQELKLKSVSKELQHDNGTSSESKKVPEVESTINLLGVQREVCKKTDYQQTRRKAQYKNRSFDIQDSYASDVSSCKKKKVDTSDNNFKQKNCQISKSNLSDNPEKANTQDTKVRNKSTTISTTTLRNSLPNGHTMYSKQNDSCHSLKKTRSYVSLIKSGRPKSWITSLKPENYPVQKQEQSSAHHSTSVKICLTEDSSSTSRKACPKKFNSNTKELKKRQEQVLRHKQRFLGKHNENKKTILKKKLTRTQYSSQNTEFNSNDELADLKKSEKSREIHGSSSNIINDLDHVQDYQQAYAQLDENFKTFFYATLAQNKRQNISRQKCHQITSISYTMHPENHLLKQSNVINLPMGKQINLNKENVHPSMELSNRYSCIKKTNQDIESFIIFQIPAASSLMTKRNLSFYSTTEPNESSQNNSQCLLNQNIPNSSGITIRSIKQDRERNLVAILTQNKTDANQEFRLPVVEVRERYPNILIDFLLQRIQFRPRVPSK